MRLALSVAAMVATVVFVVSNVNLFIVLRDLPPRGVACAIPLVACFALVVFGVASIVVG
jgi:hypothetical protein